MKFHYHKVRAYKNWLTILLTLMLTFVEDISCTIGQYASRRNLHQHWNLNVEWCLDKKTMSINTLYQHQ